MSYTRTLLVGLRDHLVAQGHSFKFVFGDLPSTPDEAVALSAYAAVDEPTVARSTVRVQFMCRGVANNSLAGDDVADALFLSLQGLEDVSFGDVHLVQCFRVSAVPMGVDESKRSTRSDNYEIEVDLPLTAGRPF